MGAKSRRTVTISAVVVGGLLVALLLAFFVSPHASSKPDGLEKVAAAKGLDTGEKAHDLGDGPLADYSLKGVDDQTISTGLAGIIGVALTFAIGLGLFFILRAVRRRNESGRAPGRGEPIPSGP